jgi:hypothetical protein
MKRHELLELQRKAEGYDILMREWESGVDFDTALASMQMKLKKHEYQVVVTQTYTWKINASDVGDARIQAEEMPFGLQPAKSETKVFPDAVKLMDHYCKNIAKGSVQ